MAENSPYLVKDIDLQIQEAESTPYNINLPKLMPRHVVIKLLKIRQRKKSKQPEGNDTLLIGKHQLEWQQI